MAHRIELSLINFDGKVLIARLALAQTNRANLRLRENRTGHIRMIRPPRFAPKNGIRKGMTFADCNRGQGNPVRDIPPA